MAGHVRKRNVGSAPKPKHEQDQHGDTRNGRTIEQTPGKEKHIGLLLLSGVWSMIGVVVCCYLGYKHAWFMNEIHETQYFFIGIQVN